MDSINPEVTTDFKRQVISLKITGNDGASGDAEAVLKIYSTVGAQKKAVKAALLFFGLAIAAVFLPIVHFVLVPLFLILSPTVYFYINRNRSKILKISGNCLYCQKAIAVENQPEVWPQEILCEACRKTMKAAPAI